MFSEVLNAGLVTTVNVDTNQSDKLLRLLDTVVIKLEGGTDEDLKVLDEKPNIENRPEPIKETPPAAALATIKTGTPQPAETKVDANDTNENEDGNGEVKEDDPIVSNDVTAVEKPANSDEKISKKRKRTTSGSSSSSSSSTSSSGKYRALKIVD